MGDDPADSARLADFALRLADEIERALPTWVVRCVEERAERWSPGLGSELGPAAHRAGREAVRAVMPDLRSLLGTDVDEQRTGPLAVVRRAVPFPTRVLDDAGVPPVERDEQARRIHPEDHHDLVPGAFADLDPDLAEIGVMWGAAKAHVIMARRRAEGRR